MAYTYPGAGKKAPRMVRMAVSAFRRLPLSTKRNVPLLWWLLPEGTPPYKMSAQDAAYQDVPRGDERCDNCRSAYEHITSGTWICDQMAGVIEPQAWCRLWRGPFDDPAFYARYQDR